MIAQPSLMAANRSSLACTTDLSTLLATKPWYDPEDEELTVQSLSEWALSLDMLQYGIFVLHTGGKRMLHQC
jgi:hypothetical protein